MEKEQPEASARRPAGASPLAAAQMRRFLVATGVLALCFSVPLIQLVKFAAHDELYSYVLLMPVVSWYLMRLKKPLIADSQPFTVVGIFFFVAGIVAEVTFVTFVRGEPGLELEDFLAIQTLAFFLMLLGVAGIFLGRETFRAAAFPLGILIFIVPMPLGMRENTMTFLQYGSAWVAAGFFKVTFSTYSRDGLIFALPGTPGLEVAPECSGIHSSWILLITSLLAGYLFLRSPWNRGILAVAVLPLALLRNGFRIFTIGELCVHIGPHMIDHWIHRKGGPIFFALSLFPFLLLMIWLRRRERRGPTKTSLPSIV